MHVLLELRYCIYLIKVPHSFSRKLIFLLIIIILYLAFDTLVVDLSVCKLLSITDCTISSSTS